MTARSTDNSTRHYRRTIRLPGYDYRQAGAYFITICAYIKICMFGNIDRAEGAGSKPVLIPLFPLKVRRNNTITSHDPLQCLPFESAAGCGIGHIALVPGKEIV